MSSSQVRRRTIFLILMGFASLGVLRCTPGAPGQVGGPAAAVSGASVVEVSLLQFAPTQTTYGSVAGYSPDPLVVRVGTMVQFHNRDSFAHTATSLGRSGFPPSNPLSTSALSQSGSDVSAAWSTGDLNAGAYSQTITATQPGIFYFGCEHHYGSPMRGVIVVQ